MNLKQLEYFVQVAELGSFSKAAGVLEVAQPALSRQIRALETELKQQLFARNGRGVALTDAGKRLFDHSVAVLDTYNGSVRRYDPVADAVTTVARDLAEPSGAAADPTLSVSSV